MLSKIYLILKILSMIKDIFKYVTGEIDEAQFHENIKKMRDSAQRASEGSVEDRLKGGSDVEDQFNDRT